MAKRPTIADVARAAGVSPATVDRVLNGRERVREETARRVYDTAVAIGYHASGLIAQRMGEDLPRMRFGFVLSKARQSFYRTLAAELEAVVAQADGIRGQCEIAYAPSQSPADIAAEIVRMRGRVDAIAACSVAHPDLTELVGDLKRDGIPTFALMNDFAQGVRHAYVGLNNLKVGRIAAQMLSLASRPGKIGIFVGGFRWHGHELRETGLRSYFRENAPAFNVLDTFVNLETRQLTYEATLDLLNRHPGIVGIYCAGGGMEGAIAALREARKPKEVALVVNELTPESRAGLTDGYVTLVISTPVPTLCRDLVKLMREAVQEGPSDLTRQVFLRPDLILAEVI
ncbi:HTH-type transcriptional regulator GalS [Roseisalinus antarcticus]|uniref:HTH-type transcriptional regulator GalS n=1 Tax=Roseisalinus antarcticus TaxID=254357 RepID=A0A1Y5SF84_9RHOB|nr:HTH-type transcriptional regulator GalS [Roseisalinus antarcticus]